MAEQFDAKKFNEYIKAYYALRQTHPYSVRTWLTNSDVVKQCLGILNGMHDQLKLLVEGINAEYHFYASEYKIGISRGAGIFPKRPWFSVLASGEEHTNGVYPVLSFGPNADGFLIGCADSIANPQAGFSSRYCYDSDSLKRNFDRLGPLGPLYDRHLAKGAKWFKRDEEVSREGLVVALVAAMKVWQEFRKTASIDNPRRCEQWVKEIIVDDIYGWIRFLVDGGENGHRWAFRGQGNADWKLTSSLERLYDGTEYDEGGRLDDDLATELFCKEREALCLFKRESAKELNYRGLRSADLIALMQHYGGKTRMLDFSWSPAAALYMAIEQHENEQLAGKVSSADKKLAVWAIDVSRFVEGEKWIEYLKNSACEANAIFNSKEMKESSNAGVLVVIPSVNNARLSAQEGLFLMQKDLRYRLHENMAALLAKGGSETFSYERENLSAVRSNSSFGYSAYKFMFPIDMIEKAKKVLKTFGVTSRSVYPDLQGLAKSCAQVLSR